MDRTGDGERWRANGGAHLTGCFYQSSTSPGHPLYFQPPLASQFLLLRSSNQTTVVH